MSETIDRITETPTSTQPATAPPARPRPRWPRRLKPLAAALAGPGLIVGAVLAILHRFAFLGMFSHERLDVLGYFFPTYCHLGTTLAEGHLPVWNPHVMAGAPFAADPQSGWMYAPAMVLFTALPCDAALRWFVILHPILGGLGLYAFLRSEGLSRAAATVAGLALALPLAGSDRVLNLPASTALAWTAVLLAAASRYLHSPSWPGRLLWLAGVALAWGQLAAAHMSDGLLRGTLVLGAYLVGRTVADLWGKRRSPVEAAAMLGAVLVALPVVNLAYFLPRLGYVPRTSITLGYERLSELSLQLSGGVNRGGVFAGVFVGPTWPLRLALSPGLHVAIGALVLTIAGVWARRHRYLVVTFVALAAAFFVLSQKGIADRYFDEVPSFIGDQWLHDPGRFSHGLFLALAVLAGLGLEGWRLAGSTVKRLLVAVPAVGAFVVLPLVFGARLDEFALPLVGAAAAAVALVAAARAADAGRARTALALAAVPAVLAAEMVASGLVGQFSAIPRGDEPCTAPIEPTPPDRLVAPVDEMRRADVHAADLLRPGPIVEALRARPDVRYLSLDPKAWSARGYHVPQDPDCWPFLGLQQSMLFGLEEGQGYNPVQLRGYWSFTRAVDPKPMRYNTAGFVEPPPVAFDLLQVGYVVGRADSTPPGASPHPIAREGMWALYPAASSAPRASVLTAWSVVGSADEALTAITTPGFDPSATVVLEEVPGLAPGASAGGNAGSAVFRWLGENAATIEVDATGPAVLLVRNAYDPGWRADVDGLETEILVGDYLLQAVPVPAGRSVVELRYHDPAIWFGLLGSGLALAAIAGLAVGLAWKGRSQRPSGRRSPNAALDGPSGQGGG